MLKHYMFNIGENGSSKGKLLQFVKLFWNCLLCVIFLQLNIVYCQPILINTVTWKDKGKKKKKTDLLVVKK